MNVRTTQFKTVSGATAQALDEALAAARSEIAARNENAQFVELRLAAGSSLLFATIVWTG